MQLFHPLIREWFQSRFGEPTEAQRLGWPHIAAGKHTLIAAPTGSGKTLAAFLACIDQLLRHAVAGELKGETQVLYISPLKALGNDIHRNLEIPLGEITELANSAGHELTPIRAMVRTGDTPASQRQAMVKKPPHILVTTPESLFLLLTSSKGRDVLRSVRTVIVDEIHALARDKRGTHLSLSLARLDQLCEHKPVRIGLSATQSPMEEIARFLVGSGNVDADTNQPACEIINIGHLRDLDLGIEVPPTELSAVCSKETWEEIYAQLAELVLSHRSTLIFVNTRRLSERVAHHLAQTLGADAVASHHGSLSRETRLSAEERLKSGQLKAIVATASLEMGIDVGYIDLVCQIGSARSIATLLQRIGRSGHSLGAIPKGRLFPLTRDELMECLALVRAVRGGRLDKIEIPHAPLDILAQQIIASVACEDWQEDELFALVRKAWPYRDLERQDFDEIVRVLSEGMAPAVRNGAYLHRDAINGRLRARRGARLAALNNGGAIPETGDFRVVVEGEGAYVGTVNEDFALESLSGDVFLLGGTSWRIRHVRGSEVTVVDAHGDPATIPFWLGEAPGRTWELSTEVSELRDELAAKIEFGQEGAVGWLHDNYGAHPWAARQAVLYVAAQTAAVGMLPTQDHILFERFFDDSGGMQLVIHAPLGTRVNRAWGLALRKRFCRSFDFELQASAVDDGVVLSLGPQHSFPIESMFKMISTENAEYLLRQALLAAPIFQTRWRWAITRALAVLRQRSGKRVPPQMQRFRSDDLLAAVFPAQTGCFENHHGDTPIPDHPMVRQTVKDCLHEAMDLPRWLDVLGKIERGEIKLTACETREASPFSHEILNANPYAFLDDAPLEERRTRAVATRRRLSIEDASDLGRLDPAAIEHVRTEAWPIVRDADELHEALLNLGMLLASEGQPWKHWFAELVSAGRAAMVHRSGLDDLWIAAERWPVIRAVYPDAAAQPAVCLPATLDRTWESAEARVALVRGRMESAGPINAEQLAALTGLTVSSVTASLEALEGEGAILRGHYTATQAERNGNAAVPLEWCDRRLLSRIHRLTLDGLRRQIQPVSPTDYIRFLAEHQRLLPKLQMGDQPGVRAAVGQLQGMELAAGVWESRILPARVDGYELVLLDALATSGELVWGRFSPPQATEDGRPSAVGLTRAAPISLALREDLPWLLPPAQEQSQRALRSGAAAVLEAITTRGALFFSELQTQTGLLPSQLEDSLGELIAQGKVTADGYGAIRYFVSRGKGKGRKRRIALAQPLSHRGRARRISRRAGQMSPASSGRWSLFPGAVPPLPHEERLERWAWQLLQRWGVLFRDLMVRETLAPRWSQLLPMLRRMEARGEIRGGRFVAGVAGEQYALPDSIEALRRVREEPVTGEVLVLSAADPLNLAGIITDEPRVAMKHTATIALRDGRLLGAQQSGEVQFYDQASAELAADLSRRLRRFDAAPSEQDLALQR